MALIVVSSNGAPIAFPGAEGLAANTRGAAGYSGAKSVAIVSNLNDTGAGSLRAACAGAGKEGTFVVFTTSGIINLASIVDVISDYITIAGQTSPGGICLAGNMLEVGTSGQATTDFIMRHMRSIAGSHGGAADEDEEAFRVWSGQDVMVDHCSLAWGADETASATSFGGTSCARLTFSWCMFTQGLTDPAPEADHGYGFFMNFNAGANNSIDLHHCYQAHHQSRMPRMAGDGFFNIVNCVHYNYWKFQNTNFMVGQTSEVNFIGNYVKPGPDSETSYVNPPPNRAGEMYGGSDLSGTPYAALFMENNFGVIRSGDADDEWAIVDNNTDALLSTSWQSGSEFASPAGGIAITKTVLLAATAEAQAVTILAGVGATKPSRDSHDTTMVADFSADTGTFKADSTYPGDWPTYSTPAAPTDTDGDGIPDSYEISQGFTATSMNPFDTAPSGYLWIEEYINSLA